MNPDSRASVYSYTTYRTIILFLHATNRSMLLLFQVHSQVTDPILLQVLSLRETLSTPPSAAVWYRKEAELYTAVTSQQ